MTKTVTFSHFFGALLTSTCLIYCDLSRIFATVGSKKLFTLEFLREMYLNHNDLAAGSLIGLVTKELTILCKVTPSGITSLIIA